MVCTFNHITHEVDRITAYVKELKSFIRNEIAKCFMSRDPDVMSILLQSLPKSDVGLDVT